MKRYRDRQVDWPEIEHDYSRAGDFNFFLFVSVSGFTERARREAESDGRDDLLLKEAADFTQFLLSGKVHPALREKLQLKLSA